MKYCIYLCCELLNIATMKKNQASKFRNEKFFGRKKELALAWEYLAEGYSLKLAAPRRIGKTFFAKEILRGAEEKGWGAIYITLEKCIKSEGYKNEIAFIHQFISELKEERWYHKFARNLEEMKVSLDAAVGDLGKIGGELDWKLQKPDIYRKLENILEKSENAIIVLDELTVFLDYLRKEEKDENGKKIENLEDVKSFLHWLRSLREAPGSKIRWIFCSSISIDSFIIKHGFSGTLNNVEPFKVGELRESEPMDFVKHLLGKAKRFPLTDELIIYMLDKLGAYQIPYFIKILFDNTYQLFRLHNREINHNLVDDAYREAIHNASYFSHWIERLKDYGEDRAYAETILSKLAELKNGKKDKQLFVFIFKENEDKRFKQIGQRLEDEGYIIINDGTWSFRSPFLREFWAKETKVMKVNKKAK